MILNIEKLPLVDNLITLKFIKVALYWGHSLGQGTGLRNCAAYYILNKTLTLVSTCTMENTKLHKQVDKGREIISLFD